MNISVLITNYKTWPLVEKAVDAIHEQDKNNLIKEVIVIDDHSNENIPERLLNTEQVRIHTNPANIGYVASVNEGFALVKEEIVLLLDSDARPLSDISSIKDHFTNDSSLGLLGFKLVDRNGNPTGSWEETPGVDSLLLGQFFEQKFRRGFSSKTNSRVVFSCAVAIRKKTFDEINGFDEGFDFLDADIDFSMRVNKTGHWKVQVDEAITMLHEGGGSPQLTAKRVIRYYRNRMRLLRKHGLMRTPFFTRTFISIRMMFEYTWFLLIGYFRYTPDVRKDKLFSRSQVIRYIYKW